ncbi:hypothetical protein [Oceanobacillus locisalsi]|uniref:Uncharacterized protein n=1 Tax=Oceanobacillus locisalsi TaxID=546107 RepID=A0ABW3NJG0_9BACI
MNTTEIMSKAVANAKVMEGDWIAKMSLALKKAWKEAKYAAQLAAKAMNEVVSIKSWFIRKNFDQNEAYTLQTAEFEIIKETEKAYRLKAMTDFGNLFVWAPKSVCLNQEQFNAEFDAVQTKMNKGLERNLELLKEAKELGIKGVRKGMKTKTLENKIAAHKAV